MKIKLLQRAFFLLIIFVVFIGGYFYFNKTLPIEFKSCEALQIVKISDEASELRGDLIFRNPNNMRAEIGKLNIVTKLNGIEIGSLHETFKTTIKGYENLDFPFQFRFPTNQILFDTTKHEAKVTIGGDGGSDVLFANYTFNISFSGTVKTPDR
jgi:hypothetical protein